MEIKYSIIVPVKEVNDFILEHITRFRNFTRRDIELIILPNDKLAESNPYENIRFFETEKVSPAIKRDLGASISRGKFLVFLDDDAFIHESFFSTLDSLFEKNSLCCIGGPAVTPETNSTKQKASGAVFESTFLSSNPERYLSRNGVQLVQDWPSVNFCLPKSIFLNIGGFGSSFWPGEDTMFCLKIVEVGIPIIYARNLIAYHHRRETLQAHLRQCSGYGYHRGYFARRFPLNSRLLRYFLPSIFLIYLITLIPYVLFFSRGSTDNFAVWLLMSPFMIYFILLILSLIEIAFRHNVKVAFWALVYFPLTHSYYALSFLKGFYSIKQLESKLR